MADDSPESANAESSNTSPSVDPDISQWIKNIGAVVTILAAVAGICFSAYQLKLKAEDDRETASLNREAEKNKLDLGLAQLKDQKVARKEQDDEHKRDIDLELRKHALDLDRQDRESLISTINGLFSDPKGGEGNLAALSLFVNQYQHQGDHEIILNAILAKSWRPPFI